MPVQKERVLESYEENLEDRPRVQILANLSNVAVYILAKTEPRTESETPSFSVCCVHIGTKKENEEATEAEAAKEDYYRPGETFRSFQGERTYARRREVLQSSRRPYSLSKKRQKINDIFFAVEHGDKLLPVFCLVLVKDESRLSQEEENSVLLRHQTRPFF